MLTPCAASCAETACTMPGMVDSVDADQMRGRRPVLRLDVGDLAERDGLEPQASARRRSSPARRASASTTSGAETISVIVKCPRRIVICESSMLPRCSRSTSATAATMPGRSRPDRG